LAAVFNFEANKSKHPSLISLLVKEAQQQQKMSGKLF
jgi:hypothetical protein